MSAQLLTRQEAADFLGVKSQTLAAWASLHRYSLRFIKVGRLTKYRMADLENWLEARSVGDGADHDGR